MAKAKKKVEIPEGKKLVLHLEFSAPGRYGLQESFKPELWHAVYVDDRPKRKPDVIAEFPTMKEIADNSADGVWAPSVLSYYVLEESVEALKAIYRVLKPGGRLILSVPNMARLAEAIMLGNLEDRVIGAADKAITPLEMLYGYNKPSGIGKTQATFKSAYTAESLGLWMRRVGFSHIQVRKKGFDLVVGAQKIAKDSKEFFDKISITDPRQPGASGLADELNRPPVMWNKIDFGK